MRPRRPVTTSSQWALRMTQRPRFEKTKKTNHARSDCIGPLLWGRAVSTTQVSCAPPSFTGSCGHPTRRSRCTCCTNVSRKLRPATSRVGLSAVLPPTRGRDSSSTRMPPHVCTAGGPSRLVLRSSVVVSSVDAASRGTLDGPDAGNVLVEGTCGDVCVSCRTALPPEDEELGRFVVVTLSLLVTRSRASRTSMLANFHRA